MHGEDAMPDERKLFISSNCSCDCDEPLPAGVRHERVEIVMVPETEQYKVRRYVERVRHSAEQVFVAETSTAAECVAALRRFCDGEMSPVARVTLFDAGFDTSTGKSRDRAFARAFTAAGLEPPPLLPEAPVKG